MNTLVISYFIISFALIGVVICTELIPSHVVSLWVKEAILAALLIGMSIGMLFVPTHLQKKEVIGDAALIERFEDADLYYDADSDFYFAVETDKWNPFEMYKRVEIPQELAQKKIMDGELTKTDP